MTHFTRLSKEEKAAVLMDALIDRFKTGDLGEPLARTFLLRVNAFDLPLFNWSATNQMLCALSGALDPRGYRQWRRVGRQVRRGEKASAVIRVPCFKQLVTDDGDEEPVLAYFRFVALFDVSQTDGDPLPYEADLDRAQAAIDALPLAGVAQAWGLSVTPMLPNGRALGVYRHGESIRLSTADNDVWLHELVHAADDRLGTLDSTTATGKAVAEIVAEMGANVLAHMIGEPNSVDDAVTKRYLEHYAGQGASLFAAMSAAIERTAAAVAHILESAELLSPSPC